MLEHLQRVALGLLPRDFRDRFGPEMLAAARAVDAERPRRPGRLLRAVADVAVTPLALRRDLRREARATHAPKEAPMVLASWLRDLRWAVRGLGREPAFTAFCTITLALGIGANTAMFGIADRLLLGGPTGVRDANRVVRVYATTQVSGLREFTTDGFGYVSYAALREGTHAFSALATSAVEDDVMGRGAEARRVRVDYATASLFPLLGVQAERGRFYDDFEDVPAATARVAVLSDAAWRTVFGAADDAVGRTILLNDEPFTIVGVAPRGFTGPQFGPVDLWVPGGVLGARVTSDWTTSWNAQWLTIVGRLKPGVTSDQAGEDVTAAHRRAYTGDDNDMRAARFFVASLRADDAGTESTDLRVLRWLTVVSALVLLIACANVTNLLLARGMRRAREVAVRAALGAGRARLVRLLLLEALLLALGGAALGLFVAWQVGASARAVLFASVAWSSPPVNGRAFVAATLLAAAAGLLIGIVPALRATRSDLAGALKSGVREGGGRRSRLRTSLTVAQAALSVVLLVGAGLFVHSFWTAYTLDVGFDPDRVTVIDASRPSMSHFPAGPARVAERLRRRDFFVNVLDRVRALPGVEQAGVAVGTPFGNRFTIGLRVEGRDALPRLPGGGPSVSAVTAGYFETMGTRIVRGRAFTPDEHAGTTPVAIVSELMADTIWPGADPLGTCLYIGDGAPPCARVVGIAENTYTDRLREDPVMHYYVPLGQESGFGGAVLLVRRTAGGTAPVAEIRRLLAGLDSTIGYVSDETLRSRIDPQLRPWRIGATVFALSGLLALVVAGIGLYSVTSYLIADRRHEIGVRLALGASAGHVTRLVLGGSVAMAMIGVVLGEAVAWSLGGLAAPLLFQTSPHDPLVFGTVGGVLLTVAVLASVGPARRARGVSALEALRAE